MLLSRTKREPSEQKKELADPVEAAQQGFRRLARLAAKTAADGTGKGLLLGEGAALGPAARRQMTERMVGGAEARARPAWRAARDRRVIGAEREGAAGILLVARSHATPFRSLLLFQHCSHILPVSRMSIRQLRIIAVGVARWTLPGFFPSSIALGSAKPIWRGICASRHRLSRAC
jgi:hypothetical protein